MCKYITTLYFLGHFFVANSQITVTNATSALQLAQKLVGTGVTISNVTYNGEPLASGLFKQVGTVIPIDSGIVITSGLAKSNIGLVLSGVDGIAADLADNDNGLTGDAQLNLLTSMPTEDATVLEFDFIPIGDSISFSYSFSSEEYTDFNCTDFNDVFAFFISGPGIIGTVNLAVVPGTNPPIPVTINSINDGTVGSGGTASNCTGYGQGAPFTTLYLSNTNGLQLTHNGLTKKLAAKARVIPCQTYHLKIAIADAGDAAYDSGVFIEANSLKSLTATMTALGTTDPSTNTVFLAEGCVAGGVKFNLPNPENSPTVLNLVIGGTATNGTDVTLIPSTVTIPANATSLTLPISALTDALTEGTELLTIYLASGCSNNLFLDSIKIQIRDYDLLNITPADSAFSCNIGTPIQLTANSGYTSYNWDANASLSSTTIANPVATPTTLPQWYYCTAQLGTCRARDSVLIKSKNIVSSSKTDIFCKDATNGAISLVPGNSFSRPISFSLNGAATQSDSNFVNLPVGAYTVTLTDAANCVRTYNFNIIQLFPDLTFSQTVVPPSCGLPDGLITVSASGGKPPYQYSLDGLNYTNTNILAMVSGNVTIYVKDANGCITTKTISVAAINSPDITGTSIVGAGCSGAADGSVQITASGGVAPYQYSADGGLTFQNNSTIMVTTGYKLLTVKDFNGCTDTLTVFIPLVNNLTANAGVDTIICEGTAIQLAGQSNAPSVVWTPNLAINNATTLSPTVNPSTTTNYILTATQGVCIRRDTVTVTLRPAPMANAGPDTAFCYGKSIVLYGSGGSLYNWQPTTNMQNNTSATPTIAPLQNIKYWLHVEDVYGCKSLVADTINITIIPPIQMFAGNDTLVAANQPLQLNGSGAPLFQWIPGTWLNNSNIANPIATIGVIGNIQYVLKGSTIEGCIGFDTLNIKVYKGPDIYVPTIFTPNGDGKNDVFQIVAVGITKFNFLRIFNRWGQLIYTTNDWTKGWNGTRNGQQQPNGAYVWMVDAMGFDGKPIRKKGTVLLEN